jgi:hypothetical protein
MAIYSEKQFLAYELAKQLDDFPHFGWYCVLLERYSSSLLFGVLSDLKERKDWSKVKNKGAYFTAMLLKYAYDKKLPQRIDIEFDK